MNSANSIATFLIILIGYCNGNRSSICYVGSGGKTSDIPLSQFLTGMNVLYTPLRRYWTSSIGDVDSEIFRSINNLTGDDAIKDIKASRERKRWRMAVRSHFSFSNMDEDDCRIISSYLADIDMLTIPQLKQIKRRFQLYKQPCNTVDHLIKLNREQEKNTKNKKKNSTNEKEPILSKDGFDFFYAIKDKVMNDGSGKMVLEKIWELFGNVINRTRSFLGKKEKSYLIGNATTSTITKLMKPHFLMSSLFESTIDLLSLLQEKKITTEQADLLKKTSIIIDSLLPLTKKPKNQKK